MPLARVLDGIAAARPAGLAPVKINMVVRRGVNEASIIPMARWARMRLILRYIEYMGRRDGERLAGWTTSCRARRSSRSSMRSSRSRRCNRTTRARSRIASATATARARSV